MLWFSATHQLHLLASLRSCVGLMALPRRIMELGGFEPAPSWVRFPKAGSRARAYERDLQGVYRLFHRRQFLSKCGDTRGLAAIRALPGKKCPVSRVVSNRRSPDILLVA